MKMKKLFAFLLFFALFAHIASADAGLSCSVSGSDAQQKISGAVYKLEFYSQKLMEKGTFAENGVQLSVDDMRARYADAFRESVLLRVCSDNSLTDAEKQEQLSLIPSKQQIVDELFRQYQIDLLALEADSLGKLMEDRGEPGRISKYVVNPIKDAFGFGGDAEKEALQNQLLAVKATIACMLSSNDTVGSFYDPSIQTTAQRPCYADFAESQGVKESHVSLAVIEYGNSVPLIKVLIAEEEERNKGGGKISDQHRFDIFYDQARELEGPYDESDFGKAAKTGLQDNVLPCMNESGYDTPKSLYTYFDIDGLDKWLIEDGQTPHTGDYIKYESHFLGHTTGTQQGGVMDAPPIDMPACREVPGRQVITQKSSSGVGDAELTGMRILGALQTPMMRALVASDNGTSEPRGAMINGVQAGGRHYEIDGKKAASYIVKDLEKDDEIAQRYANDQSLHRQNIRAIGMYSYILREFANNSAIDPVKITEVDFRAMWISQKTEPAKLPCAHFIDQMSNDNWLLGLMAAQLAVEFVVLPAAAEIGPATAAAAGTASAAGNAAVGGYFLMQQGKGYVYSAQNWGSLDDQAKEDTICSGLFLTGLIAKGRISENKAKELKSDLTKSPDLATEFDAGLAEGKPSKMKNYFANFKDILGESKSEFSRLNKRVKNELILETDLRLGGQSININAVQENLRAQINRESRGVLEIGADMKQEIVQAIMKNDFSALRPGEMVVRDPGIDRLAAQLANKYSGNGITEFRPQVERRVSGSQWANQYLTAFDELEASLRGITYEDFVSMRDTLKRAEENFAQADQHGGSQVSRAFVVEGAFDVPLMSGLGDNVARFKVSNYVLSQIRAAIGFNGREQGFALFAKKDGNVLVVTEALRTPDSKNTFIETKNIQDYAGTLEYNEYWAKHNALLRQGLIEVGDAHTHLHEVTHDGWPSRADFATGFTLGPGGTPKLRIIADKTGTGIYQITPEMFSRTGAPSKLEQLQRDAIKRAVADSVQYRGEANDYLTYMYEMLDEDIFNELGITTANIRAQ